jgi:hypothetical protein
MAKFPYMKEVDSEDEDFNDGKPDPTYIDPDAPQGGTAVFPVADLAEDWKNTEAETIAAAKAAAEGRAALDEQEPEPELEEAPPFDDDGHALLGYDEDEVPVYETDEERDERIVNEEANMPSAEQEAELRAEQAATKKKRK